jgi:hypothetical protein
METDAPAILGISNPEALLKQTTARTAESRGGALMNLGEYLS